MDKFSQKWGRGNACECENESCFVRRNHVANPCFYVKERSLSNTM